jgi:DtxR family transcriptional regulator, Mn-dependent transcriptional regulator
MPRLYDLEPGEVAKVALSGSMESSLVAFLENLGVRPDAQVEVISKQPFDGPLELRVDGATRMLGEKVARQIFVKTLQRD